MRVTVLPGAVSVRMLNAFPCVSLPGESSLHCVTVPARGLPVLSTRQSKST